MADNTLGRVIFPGYLYHLINFLQKSTHPDNRGPVFTLSQSGNGNNNGPRGLLDHSRPTMLSFCGCLFTLSAGQGEREMVTGVTGARGDPRSRLTEITSPP